PLLWLAGSYSLSRLHRALLRASPAFRAWPLGRATAFAALLTIPLAAVWPPLLARLDEVTGRDGATLFPAERIQAALGLPGASVQAGQEQVRELRLVVDYLRSHSEPGDRIFVYPAAPLLYFLADRPNATRFNHLLPGLLSPAEVVEAIAALEHRPAVYVVWDARGAL